MIAVLVVGFLGIWVVTAIALCGAMTPSGRAAWMLAGVWAPLAAMAGTLLIFPFALLGS
ncbi:MAG TPA: hypothetical protein VMT88_02315 [Actinomycetes bacterium]|nr:hypothetical protein [Actinomycetes bacterium]